MGEHLWQQTYFRMKFVPNHLAAQNRGETHCAPDTVCDIVHRLMKYGNSLIRMWCRCDGAPLSKKLLQWYLWSYNLLFNCQEICFRYTTSIRSNSKGIQVLLLWFPSTIFLVTKNANQNAHVESIFLNKRTLHWTLTLTLAFIKSMCASVQTKLALLSCGEKMESNDRTFLKPTVLHTDLAKKSSTLGFKRKQNSSIGR